jgi:hypothetical protein
METQRQSPSGHRHYLHQLYGSPWRPQPHAPLMECFEHLAIDRLREINAHGDLHHKDKDPEPTTLQHVLTLSGIVACVALTFYAS